MLFFFYYIGDSLVYFLCTRVAPLCAFSMRLNYLQKKLIYGSMMLLKLTSKRGGPLNLKY
jgi:hypothetical protein